MTDCVCVLDAVGSKSAAVLAMEGGGLINMVFAAAFPERTRALVLINAYATLSRYDDYPWGMPPQALERWIQGTMAQWGTGESLRVLAPELADDERYRVWFSRYDRAWMSQASIRVIVPQLGTIDVRGVLPAIKSPTLVISHADMPWVRTGHSRYLAEKIPGARLIERPGFWGLFWLHDVDWVLDEIQAFFTGTRGTPDLDDRVLATVMFTDIVGSTERAASIGDKRWRLLLEEHEDVARREIQRFRGRLIKSTGDGFLVTFDGPARATRCALAVTDAVKSLGIEVRVGLHTGEIELRDEDVHGIAVHITERVTAEAAAGEVLVSGAVPPLVAGSGIEFDDRGPRTLKGVPGEWRLFAVRGQQAPG
jgi:class 3 adenylate cyclase